MMVNSSSMKLCVLLVAAILLNNALGFVTSPLRAIRGNIFSNKVSIHEEDAEVVKKEKKYIVVTGGVISGIGKGTTYLSLFCR